jgi:hypothetical protein
LDTLTQIIPANLAGWNSLGGIHQMLDSEMTALSHFFDFLGYGNKNYI